MKIILSRKGVDSSSGGFASPILKHSRLLPVAIPDDRSPIRYRDLRSDPPLGKMVKHLSQDRLNCWSRVHLDPDLIKDGLAGRDNFIPVFGQCGAAQTHLASHDVGAGDLFLFFGWFKQVELYRRRWRYLPRSPDLHVIFGWMQVDKVVPVDSVRGSGEYDYLKHHPHCFGDFSGQNTLYIGRKKLSYDQSLNGSGVFDYLSDARTLTATGCNRSLWRVPHWMYPQGRESVLSYHQDSTRWRIDSERVLLQSVARGQEFILNTDHYPEALDWAVGLLSESL